MTDDDPCLVSTPSSTHLGESTKFVLPLEHDLSLPLMTSDHTDTHDSLEGKY